jgi:hypothetical protein
LEVHIIAEFHQINLFFAKQQLHLEDFQTAVLLNILWILLKNKNPSYSLKEKRRKSSKKLVEKEKIRDSLLRKSKNKMDDML